MIKKCKRQLSIFEKESLLYTDGLALVMPAEPNGEVEELIAAGYHERMIIGVEKDQTLADSLHIYYWDTVDIKWSEIGFWLHRSKAFYGYIHLDYCSQFKNTSTGIDVLSELHGLESTMSRLTSHARIRVSTYEARRKPEQIADEAVLANRSIQALCKAGAQEESFNAEQ